MQNKTSPLILTFGTSSPVGAAGIYADLATFSAMGCHGLPVVTSIMVGDTSHIEDIQPIDAELIAGQARVVLEDMPISAFKIGELTDIDSIATIAEIISDYPDIPLILDPFTYYMQSQPSAEDDLLTAISELLIPQTTLLILSARELELFAESWREPVQEDILITDLMHLIDVGTEYVFVTDTENQSNDIVNILCDENGIVQKDSWARPQGNFLDVHTTLSAAITAMFAHNADITEALTEAQEFTLSAIKGGRQLGMGKRVLDHYFWARDTASEES